MNKIRIAGAAAGVVLVSGVVLQVSSAAFTDTTENAGNSWDAGTVYLSDSQSGTAMYASATETNMKPGYNQSRCMTVTYEGSLDPSGMSFAGEVTLNNFDATGDGLADDLDVLVEMGPEGSTCVGNDIVAVDGGVLGLLGTGITEIHDGTLATLDAAGAIPIAAWTPDGQAAANDATRIRTFRFTVSMPDGTEADGTTLLTPNDAQGDEAAATFSWTATS